MILGDRPEIIVFYVSVVCLLLNIILTGYYWRLRRQSPLYGLIAKGLEFMLFALFILNMTGLIGSIDDALRNIYVINIYEENVYSMGYLLYLSFIFYGMNRFLGDTIRLDEARKDSITGANRSINYLIVLLVVLAGFSSLNLFIKNLQNNEIFYNIIEFLFAIISQLAIIIFIYFAWNLNDERKETKSKLSKARLELIIYCLIIQIIISLEILIATMMLVFISKNQNTDRVIESFLFIFMNMTIVIAFFIVVSSLSIPNWVRNRYDLGSERFSKIIELNDME